MSMIIQEQVMQLLPARRRSSSKGWISFNAVCCTHNGESADTRGRGGVRPGEDGSISYHCFNCGYKTGYRIGRPLGYRFRRWLEWLGADDNVIQRLNVEAMRLRDEVDTQLAILPKKKIEFVPRELPPNSASIREYATIIRLQLDYNDDGTVDGEQVESLMPAELTAAVEYLIARKVTNLKKYDFYISTDQDNNMHQRLIIPLKWQGNIIGYTARALVDGVKPKYYTNHEPDFVFNMDMQTADRQFVIVTEGPFDAMSVDGVAILGSEVSDQQVDIIDSLKKKVIVVPDFDVKINERTGKKMWSGRALIDAALENDWCVSFPLWAGEYKDIAEAVQKTDKLFVLKSIIDAHETSALKIELLTKKLYNTL